MAQIGRSFDGNTIPFPRRRASILVQLSRVTIDSDATGIPYNTRIRAREPVLAYRKGTGSLDPAPCSASLVVIRPAPSVSPG